MASNDDDLMMLDCFDPDDPEISDLLTSEFSDAVAFEFTEEVKSEIKSDSSKPVSQQTTSQQTEMQGVEMQEAEMRVSSNKGTEETPNRGDQRSRPSPASGHNRKSSPQRACKVQERQDTRKRHLESDCYDDMLTKLAASMKRSEMSRARVMQQRQNSGLPRSVSGTPMNHGMSRSVSNSSMTSMNTGMAPSNRSPQRSGSFVGNQQRPAQQRHQFNDSMSSMMEQSSMHTQFSPAGGTGIPQFQSIVGLSGFLNGQRTTLTSGLEQSRRQLKQYMSQVNHNMM